MNKLTFCPTCGSKKIKQIRRNLVRNFQGRSYVVPNLEYHECPDCGERVYDPQAMRKIEAHSPAYAKKRRRKEAA